MWKYNICKQKTKTKQSLNGVKSTNFMFTLLYIATFLTHAKQLILNGSIHIDKCEYKNENERREREQNKRSKNPRNGQILHWNT